MTEKPYVFIMYRKSVVVGSQTGFYDDLAKAVKKAETYFTPYKADLVVVYFFDENRGEFIRKGGFTSRRKDIKWKEVFNSHVAFPADFFSCQEIAKQVGYKFMLFNGYVYAVGKDMTPNDEICEEKDLIV